jgi:hypothetical protein
MGLVPACRAASSALNVPSALCSKSERGSVTEVVTAVWPARCTTTPVPRAASASVS